MKQLAESDYDYLFSAKLRKYFTLLLITVYITFGLAILTYGDNFVFWRYAVSHLGGHKTMLGNPNFLSFSIFVLGMVISGIIMLRIGFYLRKERLIQFKSPIRILSFSSGIGFFIMTFPHDVLLSLHMTGASLMVGSLWALSILLLLESLPYILLRHFILYQIILQGTVLPYAFTFFINIPQKEIAQKFAIVVLTIKLFLTINLKTS